MLLGVVVARREQAVSGLAKTTEEKSSLKEKDNPESVYNDFAQGGREVAGSTILPVPAHRKRLGKSQGGKKKITAKGLHSAVPKGGGRPVSEEFEVEPLMLRKVGKVRALTFGG